MDAEQGGTAYGREADQSGAGDPCSVCGSAGCCPDLHTPQADARRLQCPGAPRLPPPALPPDIAQPPAAVGHPPLGFAMPAPGLDVLPPLLQQPRGAVPQHMVAVMEAATILRRSGAPSVTVQGATWLGGPAANLPPWQAAMLGIQLPPATHCGPATQETTRPSGSSSSGQAATAGQDCQQPAPGPHCGPPDLEQPRGSTTSGASSTTAPAPTTSSSSPAAAFLTRPPPPLQGAERQDIVDE
jgi:hypothetical protein